MPPSASDLALVAPELWLAGWAFLVFTADLFLPATRKTWLAYLSLAGLVVVALSALSLGGVSAPAFGGILVVDRFAVFFKLLFAVIAAFVILCSIHYVQKRLSYPGEYYALILLSTLGMMLLAASAELITAYISLELVSFSLYVLVSYAKTNAKSNEGGMKYMLLGAFASALLLYGLSFLYGVTGETSFEAIAVALKGGPTGGSLALSLAVVLLLAGLSFKVAAVPFHMWAPDAYEGAPTPVTAFIAVASKAAGFALVLRIFVEALSPLLADWRGVVALLAALTMVVGNLVAIQQRNIKRMLAYSSVGQVGYLLVGVAALTPDPEHGAMATSAMLLHLAGYAAANLAAFLVVILLDHATGKDDIPDFAGLAERAPFAALALTASLFSLAGLPIFAGFVTKFYIFAAAAQADLLWLVLLATLMSLVSFYYYLMVVKQMYMVPAPEPGRLRVPALLTGTLAVLLALVVFIGVWPQPLASAAEAASAVLFR